MNNTIDTWYSDNVFTVSPRGEIRNYNSNVKIMTSIQ
jgi:hypothetical protein